MEETNVTRRKRCRLQTNKLSVPCETSTNNISVVKAEEPPAVIIPKKRFSSASPGGDQKAAPCPSANNCLSIGYQYQRKLTTNSKRAEYSASHKSSYRFLKKKKRLIRKKTHKKSKSKKVLKDENDKKIRYFYGPYDAERCHKFGLAREQEKHMNFIENGDCWRDIADVILDKKGELYKMVIDKFKIKHVTLPIESKRVKAQSTPKNLFISTRKISSFRYRK